MWVLGDRRCAGSLVVLPRRGTPPLKARRGVLKGGCTGAGGGPGPPLQSEKRLSIAVVPGACEKCQSIAVVPGACGASAAGLQSKNPRRGVLKCGYSGTDGAPGPWWLSPGGGLDARGRAWVLEARPRGPRSEAPGCARAHQCGVSQAAGVPAWPRVKHLGPAWRSAGGWVEAQCLSVVSARLQVSQPGPE